MSDSNQPTPDSEGKDGADPRSVLARSLRLAVVLAGVILVALAVGAVLLGNDPDVLPFDYAGFD
jgi:hypothetical protein